MSRPGRGERIRRLRRSRRNRHGTKSSRTDFRAQTAYFTRTIIRSRFPPRNYVVAVSRSRRFGRTTEHVVNPTRPNPKCRLTHTRASTVRVPPPSRQSRTALRADNVGCRVSSAAPIGAGRRRRATYNTFKKIQGRHHTHTRVRCTHFLLYCYLINAVLSSSSSSSL